MVTALPPRDLEQVQSLAGQDLSEFNGARIFLTGGTGFFGRWLTESWAFAHTRSQHRGELHILSRDPEAWKRGFPHLARYEGIYIHQGDQTNFTPLGGSFDAVIHGAVEHRTPAETFLKNLKGMSRVLDFSLDARVSRFLLISSGAVYGVQPPALDRLPENFVGARDPLEASSAYGLMKSASEFLASEATRRGGPACVISRAFSFVGPGLPLDGNYAVGNFIRDAMGNGPLMIQGDGTPFRSYLYAGDLAVWLWALLARGVAGRAYNVGSPDPISILKLAERVRDVLCPGRAISVSGRPDHLEPPSRYVPDTSLAERELGLRVSIQLDEAIRRTAEWTHIGAGSWV